MSVRVELTGGGPGDGQSFVVRKLEEQSKLQEKKYGDAFFWCYLYKCNPDGTNAHIYVEDHPHFEPDFLPPKRIELSYTNQIPIWDFK